LDGVVALHATGKKYILRKRARPALCGLFDQHQEMKNLVGDQIGEERLFHLSHIGDGFAALEM
jgi:hypothetical protein